MKEKIRKIAIVMLIGFILLSFINTYYHEETHRQIGRNYGCINDQIKINWKGGEYTCHEYREVTTQQEQDELKLHMMNEIVTYNLNGISYTIFLGTLGIISTIMMVTIDKKE